MRQGGAEVQRLTDCKTAFPIGFHIGPRQVIDMKAIDNIEKLSFRISLKAPCTCISHCRPMHTREHPLHNWDQNNAYLRGLKAWQEADEIVQLTLAHISGEASDEHLQK